MYLEHSFPRGEIFQELVYLRTLSKKSAELYLHTRAQSFEMSSKAEDIRYNASEHLEQHLARNEDEVGTPHKYTPLELLTVYQIERENGKVLLTINTNVEKGGNFSNLKLATDGRVSTLVLRSPSILI